MQHKRVTRMTAGMRCAGAGGPQERWLRELLVEPLGAGDDEGAALTEGTWQPWHASWLRMPLAVSPVQLWRMTLQPAPQIC